MTQDTVIDCVFDDCQTVCEDMDELVDHVSDDHDYFDRIIDMAEPRPRTTERSA